MYNFFVFQADTDSLYLTDSANVAVFHMENGDFCSLGQLTEGIMRIMVVKQL